MQLIPEEQWKCKKCKFWKKGDGDITHVQLSVCRRYPHSIPKSENDGCGEFEPSRETHS
jgi:hypothetical protein